MGVLGNKRNRVILIVCVAAVAVFLILGAVMGLFTKRIDVNATRESEGGAGSGAAVQQPGADPGVLPGMPEGYKLTREQVQQKKAIAEGVLPAFGVMRAGADYVDGEFLFSAADDAEAELIVAAYDGELLSFDYGFGVGKLRDGSLFTLGDLLEASADTGNNLPPIELNIIMKPF